MDDGENKSTNLASENSNCISEHFKDAAETHMPGTSDKSINGPSNDHGLKGRFNAARRAAHFDCDSSNMSSELSDCERFGASSDEPDTEGSIASSGASDSEGSVVNSDGEDSEGPILSSAASDSEGSILSSDGTDSECSIRSSNASDAAGFVVSSDGSESEPSNVSDAESCGERSDTSDYPESLSGGSPSNSCSTSNISNKAIHHSHDIPKIDISFSGSNKDSSIGGAHQQRSLRLSSIEDSSRTDGTNSEFPPCKSDELTSKALTGSAESIYIVPPVGSAESTTIFRHVGSAESNPTVSTILSVEPDESVSKSSPVSAAYYENRIGLIKSQNQSFIDRTATLTETLAKSTADSTSSPDSLPTDQRAVLSTQTEKVLRTEREPRTRELRTSSFCSIC